MTTRLHTLLLATAVAGSLDIGSAFVLVLPQHRSPIQVLQGVASGPFGKWAARHPDAGAAAGLATHFTLMAVMVSAFMLAAARVPALARKPLLSGPVYGLVIYAVMYWIVLPLRWPTIFPDTSPSGIVVPILVHMTLVGLPIAMIVARRSSAR